jgi:biopolymer transport protein ExbD
MAQIEGEGGGRSANIELNLVPFIDLMSVLITFLLITAVWTQVSMIQLGSSIYGKKTQDDITPPPPMADIPLRLDVQSGGFRLIIGSEKVWVPSSGAGAAAGYDVPKLLQELKKVKEKYPAKSDAVITVEDQLAYESLILGMDTLSQGGFPAISVATGAAE